jgi:hypothetical protein
MMMPEWIYALFGTATLALVGGMARYIFTSLSTRFTSQDKVLSGLAGGHDTIREELHNVAKRVEAIQVTVLGQTGQNGLNSEVKMLRTTQDEHSKLLADIEVTMNHLPRRAGDKGYTGNRRRS